MSLSEVALQRQLKDSMTLQLPSRLREKAVSNAEAIIGKDGFREGILSVVETPVPQPEK